MLRWRDGISKTRVVFRAQRFLFFFLMKDDDRRKIISKRLDSEVKMSRTSQVPDPGAVHPYLMWETSGGRGGWSVRHKHIQIRHETCEAISRIGSQGLGKSRSLRVPQTCPWTQFPGNRLIPCWKWRGESYYLTQPARRRWAMIENSARKMRPKETTAPKFVCAVTFILFVFVCAWLCVRASLIYSMVVRASPTLWAKEACNLHFCAHVQEQQQINTSA